MKIHFFITENTTRLDYKYQLVYAVLENYDN
jgi:hypothetical protein